MWTDPNGERELPLAQLAGAAPPEEESARKRAEARLAASNAAEAALQRRFIAADNALADYLDALHEIADSPRAGIEQRLLALALGVRDRVAVPAVHRADGGAGWLHQLACHATNSARDIETNSVGPGR